MTDVPSYAAIYTLIYTFLTEKSLTKTAQALKKEVKDVVVLKDGLKPDGPSLETIFKQWKTQEGQKKQPTSCVRMSNWDSGLYSLILVHPNPTVCLYCITDHPMFHEKSASDDSDSDSDSDLDSGSDSDASKTKAKAKSPSKKTEVSSDSSSK